MSITLRAIRVVSLGFEGEISFIYGGGYAKSTRTTLFRGFQGW